MEMQMTDQNTLVRELGLPIHESRYWLKFLGIMSVIQGILAALTIFGIIFAWLPIWVGVLLYQSASIMERAQIAGDKKAFGEAMGKLKIYFTIQGIIALIGVIAAAIVLYVGVLGAMLDILR
jgi:hypothetical protein